MIGLGIDIESRIDARLAGEIRGVVVDAAEQAVIEAGFDDAVAGLAAAFSAKEALYKALYPQVRAFFGFEAMRLARVDEGRLRFLAAADLSPTVRAGQAFEVDIAFGDGGVRSIACCLRARG
ncbi:4'-phosphopantetheinyl transferase family protein [Lysobacter capsici]|uniref:4'-phosphopantetheinyl transferase family protein n=1 Tax=Lysobacter capsici TaxID=435897 RepID=UPI00398CD5D2